jgi:hypothetical protein
MSATLDTPALVVEKLQGIERDLELRQNILEAAALNWFRAKRDKEHARAVAFIAAEGTVAERSAQADLQTSLIGRQEEAEFEALRAVIRVLEARATIGQSILRSQGRT